jgi:ABC-type nickel/cobalt efflux system permease component RcnA
VLVPSSLRILVLASIVVATVAIAALGDAGAGAHAHPLGNFTINHATRVDVTSDGISVFRVLEMAEIPAFQARGDIDGNGDGAIDDAEASSWGKARAAELAHNIALRIDGDDVSLTSVAQALTFPDGQGGLSLLRLEVTYTGRVADGWLDGGVTLELDDGSYGDRIGWREVIVRAGPGVELASTTALTASPSDELRAYPEGDAGAPPDMRSVSASLRRGAGAPLPAVERHERATRGNPDAGLARFSALVERHELTAGAVAVALLAATAFGAIHALSPGHGKTVVAAYLVGSRGTLPHALLLAGVVTVTHTSSVYALGFATLYLSEYVVPEDLYPWLGLGSGALILLLGGSLMANRLRASGIASLASTTMTRWLRQPLSLRAETGAMALAGGPVTAPAAADEHDHPPHDHADGAALHSHLWGAAHTHAIPGQDGEAVTWRSLVGLGIFGGMLPCPSAIVVMLSAIALHRVLFGLLLIVAFSFGLALVLTAIGFVLVLSRGLARRLPLFARDAASAEHAPLVSLAVRAFPVLSASAVVVAGAVITLRAYAQM